MSSASPLRNPVGLAPAGSSRVAGLSNTIGVWIVLGVLGARCVWLRFCQRCQRREKRRKNAAKRSDLGRQGRAPLR